MMMMMMMMTRDFIQSFFFCPKFKHIQGPYIFLTLFNRHQFNVDGSTSFKTFVFFPAHSQFYWFLSLFSIAFSSFSVIA